MNIIKTNIQKPHTCALGPYPQKEGRRKNIKTDTVTVLEHAGCLPEEISFHMQKLMIDQRSI